MIVITSYKLQTLLTKTHLVAGVQSIGDGVLVDVKGCQPQGDLVLQLRREPLLDDVVAALDIEILEGHRVRPQQLVGVGGDEGDPEQAAEVVSARSGGDLEDFDFNFTLVLTTALEVIRKYKSNNLLPVLKELKVGKTLYDGETQHLHNIILLENILYSTDKNLLLDTIKCSQNSFG